MFKIAVIGCGNIAMVHGPSHAQYSSKNDSIILAACCDIDIKKAESFAKDFGYERVYSDWEAMLKEIKPDAICMYLSPHVTSVIACKVLALGYPLLLEKPPGINVKEANNIKVVAEKFKVPTWWR